MFKKVLVANRGEIAVRVLRACEERGIATATVFSDVDRTALHVRYADEAYHIGPAPSRDSYLRIDKIIDVARKAGVDAVHPGYGFLAENAEFAAACADAGITFIGPSPDAIAKMGDKQTARETVARNNVPLVPGSSKGLRDEELKTTAVQTRIPADDQGDCGRRRQRDARRPRSQPVHQRPAGCAARGDRRLRQRRGLPGKIYLQRPPYRGADPGRQLRKYDPPGRAGMFDPAAASEADRRGAQRGRRRKSAPGAWAGCRGRSRIGRLCECRYDRIPVRRQRREVLTSWR